MIQFNMNNAFIDVYIIRLIELFSGKHVLTTFFKHKKYWLNSLMKFN